MLLSVPKSFKIYIQREKGVSERDHKNIKRNKVGQDVRRHLERW